MSARWNRNGYQFIVVLVVDDDSLVVEIAGPAREIEGVQPENKRRGRLYFKFLPRKQVGNCFYVHRFRRDQAYFVWRGF